MRRRAFLKKKLLNKVCYGVRPLSQYLRLVETKVHATSRPGPPHATYPPWLASRNLSTCEGAVTALLWCSASSAPGSLFVSGGIPFVSRDAPGYCCWGRLLGSGQKSILCRHLNSSLALQQTSHGLSTWPGQMGWRQTNILELPTNIHGSTFCPCMICFCYISLHLHKIGQNLISAGHWDQYITLY